MSEPEVSSPESLLARAMLTRDFETLHRCGDCYEVEAGHILDAVPELRRRLSESERLRALRQQFDEYAHDAGEEWARRAWAIAVRRIDALLQTPESGESK